MQMQIFVKTLTGKTITLEFIDNNSFTTPLQQQVEEEEQYHFRSFSYVVILDTTWNIVASYE